MFNENLVALCIINRRDLKKHRLQVLHMTPMFGCLVENPRYHLKVADLQLHPRAVAAGALLHHRVLVTEQSNDEMV